MRIKKQAGHKSSFKLPVNDLREFKETRNYEDTLTQDVVGKIFTLASVHHWLARVPSTEW